MYRPNVETLENEYGKWLTENCTCACIDDCDCIDFDSWFDERKAEFYASLEQDQGEMFA
jgi:hypothetical protein